MKLTQANADVLRADIDIGRAEEGRGITLREKAAPCPVAASAP
jgi:hypothetical protein